MPPITIQAAGKTLLPSGLNWMIRNYYKKAASYTISRIVLIYIPQQQMYGTEVWGS